MARVEGNAVVIEQDWPTFKLRISVVNNNFRYEESDTAYELFIVDEKYIYTSTIYKADQAPQDQALYDGWRFEFENIFKNISLDSDSTASIGGVANDGNIRALSVTLDGGKILNVQDENNNQLLIKMYLELKKISFLLEQMSDVKINSSDLE